MSLQLVLGGSGSGKSQYLCDNIIHESIAFPKDHYIFVVPEQYTMETQKKLVFMHPRHCIMDIDIVSFQRLAYRVFDEVGGGDIPVLDDIGKLLIITKVMEDTKKELKFFGGNVGKTGFVSEMKSVISEFLQYAVTPGQIKEVIKNIDQNPLLCGKLSDIEIIYAAFKTYLSENYITDEEILDVLCGILEKSEKIKNSVIAIDGFTGFTPIQYKLIGILLKYARKVCITVTIDFREKINVREGMHNLFFFSKETIYKLMKTADEQGILVLPHKIMEECYRLRGTEALSFLEKNIFRFHNTKYMDVPEDLCIYEGRNPKEEASYIVEEIMKLTAVEGYRYRQIAVVSGDMEVYKDIVGKVLNQNKIPCFIDHKYSVMGNPFVEFIRSALEIIVKGYSYESMFRYLKTGMTGISMEDTDHLENYCIALGIAGRKKWNEKWIRNYQNNKGENVDLTRLNDLREIVIQPLLELEENFKVKGKKYIDFVTALYYFIVSMDIKNQLSVYESRFEDAGDKGKSGEYRQIYKKVIELFDKIVEIIGEETATVREFARIMDSGFEEIKIGLIPPSADCVMVGDIERTRLGDIKVLFFAGVNDGIIPQKGGGKGILSEFDREDLEGIQVKLAPNARERAFIQKFYLYLNLTKPSEKLYISYAKNDSSGKSLHPSYLVHTVYKMFPKLKIITDRDAENQFQYIRIPKAEIIWKEENCAKTLGEAAALALYGQDIYGSVTRMESFASCAYAHFLKYGLGLKEREKHQIVMRDVGNILHSVLESVSKTLQKENRSFTDIDERTRERIISESIIEITGDYGNTVMQENKRNEYLIQRLERLVNRTVWAVGKQLQKGEFKPVAFEMPFTLEAEELQDHTKMTLHGKIDRIDICEDEQNLYVKVVDYKSGNSDFELLKTYYGIKLQLMTYLKAAMDVQGKIHKEKEIIPAGVLYYNISNPIVEKGGQDNEKIEEKILEKLCTKGLVSKEKEIANKLDGSGGKSNAVPLKYNKDGEVENTRSVISTEQFMKLNGFISHKFKELSANMISGDISLQPYRYKQSEPCMYCSYHSVCGFYEDIPGMDFKKLKTIHEDELWEQIDLAGGNERKGESGRNESVDERAKKSH